MKRNFISSYQSFCRTVYEPQVPMEIHQDLKLAVGWNKFNLKILGAWPDADLFDGYFSEYRALIPILLMACFISGPQLVNLFFVWGDIDLVTENLATASVPVTNALLKLCALWYHRKVLRPLLNSFYEDWYTVKDEEDRRLMLVNAKLVKSISMWCTVLTQVMVTLFITLRIVTVFNADRDKENQDHLVIYPAYFPYNVRPTPILLLTCLTQIVAAYYSTVSYTGVDSFISMLILHACSQFLTLRRKLENLMSGEFTEMRKVEFQRELSWIVKRHEHLNWFASCVEDSFNLLLLIQILLCTIQICFQGFQIFSMVLRKEYPILQLFFFPFFVSFIIVHLYVYCLIGEMLLTESSGMSDSAYESKWFNVPPNEAKCLLFIMQRSMIPIRLTAGKFGTFSMEMFSKILKTSMSYLSVLVTVAASG